MGARKVSAHSGVHGDSPAPDGHKPLTPAPPCACPACSVKHSGVPL